MFFLWKDRLYKWLLFTLLLVALLGTLSYSLFLVYVNYFSQFSGTVFYVPAEFPGTIMPYHTGLVAIPLAVSAFVGWFFSAAFRPIGGILVKAPSIIMLFIDGFTFIAATFIFLTGTEISPSEIIFPALARIAYHTVILCLHRQWQA